MTDTAETRPGQKSNTVLPRGLLIVLGFAASVITVAGMKAVAGIISPVFLAVVLMITVFPIRGWLVRHRVPNVLATVATILAVYAILIAMLVALIVSVARMAALVPTYAPQINDLVDNVTTWLGDLGVKKEQTDTLVNSLDVGKLFGYATDILKSALSILTNVFLIGILVLFIGLDAARFPTHLLSARDERPAVVDALVSFASGTRKYFAVSAGFGLVVAIIDTAALYALGIPAAGVWGVLAFVTNFIPNIGFVIGVIPPALIGLLEGGVGTMLAVIIIYCLINFVIQSVIQPKIVGDALGLSTTLTFVSLMFWAWVIGPMGALLAIPLTLLAKALLIDVDPEARWALPLISGNPNKELEAVGEAADEPPDAPAEEPVDASTGDQAEEGPAR
ncbi:AI-2E family transporter [Marmoricola sp. RAF53]|uniref:AI-2E family transporter n=1 Tax=Marmoricola sp. RAF53 TaxID=3233059 RepID=UPI003F9D4A46